MKWFECLLGLIVVGGVRSLQGQVSRRGLFESAATVATAAVVAPRQVLAADEDPLTPLYFGVGVSR